MEKGKVKKSKVVTIAKLKAKLDLVFKAYIRQRDMVRAGYWSGYFECISCGQTKPKDQLHAGHFYASTFTAVRWDERNVNGQCAGCNVFKHGNLLNYRKGMIEKWGQQVVDELEALHNKPFKLDREWLEEKIEYYKNQIEKEK